MCRSKPPWGGAVPVWDSAVVGAGCRVWLVRKGFCSPSCSVDHTCADLSVYPCWAPSVFVSVGRCTMITCQGCYHGTMVGGVACTWACNHTAVFAFAVT